MRIFLSMLLLVGLFGFVNADNEKDTMKEEKTNEEVAKETKVTPENPIVLMQTNYGDITIEVYEKEVPIHAGNFLKLVDEGFYDSLTFHRIVPNFVIQGGDPDGTGMGGAPGKLADDPSSPYKHDRATVSMARGRTDASTSQFYINLKQNYRLDDMGFLIFAKVTDGMDVVDKIAAVKRDKQDKPLEPVIMTKVARLETNKDVGEKSDK